MECQSVSRVFKLTALRSLGSLADAEPIVIIDTREQDPLPFSRLKSQTSTLTTGDYSVAGLVGCPTVSVCACAKIIGTP
jgi:hypothetical protein